MLTRRLFATAATSLALAVSACATTSTADLQSAPPVVTTPAESAAVARRDNVDTSVPTQLPRTARPTRYALTVTPDAANLAFTGKEVIDLTISEPTDKLVLNAVDMRFDRVSISTIDGTAVTGAATVDDDNQTATFSFGQTLQPGSYQLALDYKGKISDQANGLFALDYKNPAGVEKRALFTQFEPADARRFIPSWDEPDYKTTFDLTAVVPADQMAVSNMPATGERDLGNGTKAVTFQRTPEMSSYLLFFGTGEFSRIAKMADANTEVGVVMGRGNEAKGQTALDAQAQILPYYNDYFGIDYPLPKLDNIAGPGQSQFFSAMENWGAIFTFERILLDDPAVTTEGERQAIFEVNAHEMAHQWFGDLVTMAWWDDLWLNEGFASWMATKATKHFHPDWGAEYGVVGAREGAMRQDALSTTHPIVQNVRTVEQANQAFDGITYSKGESVISMFEAYAGADVWQRGIQSYMKAHAYQNTRTDDLWSAVESAGATGLSAIAHDFTMQQGVPLIRVGAATCDNGQTRVTLTQDEYSYDRKPGSFAPLSWKVPVRLSTGGDTTTVVTNGRATLASVPGCGVIVANSGQTGYFRSLYTPTGAKALITAYPTLSPIDQYGVLDDQFELSRAGYQNMAVGLDILNAVPANASPELLGNALGSWASLYGMYDNDKPTQDRIGRIIQLRFGPYLQSIGFVPVKGEKPTITTLRPALIGMLGRVGDPRVNAEAKRLFVAMQTNPNAVSGGLKRTWLAIVARNATSADWDNIRQMAKNAKSATERQNLYSLLGAAKDEALAKRTLALALTDEPGKTVSAGMISAVAGSHPELALDFVLSNLAGVTKLIDTTSQSRYIARLAGGSDEVATIAKLDAYAKANLAATDRKPIDEAIASIRSRSVHAPQVKAETKAWLAAPKTA